VSENAFYTSEGVFTKLAPPFYFTKMAQISDFLIASIIPEAIYTNPVIAPPTDLAASLGTYCDGIHLNWEPAYGATRYEIWWSANKSFSDARRIATTTANAFIDRGVTPGEGSYYWVARVPGAGSRQDNYCRQHKPPAAEENLSTRCGRHSYFLCEAN
jgi:hypothetical protein